MTGSRPTQDTTPAEVIAAHMFDRRNESCKCGKYWTPQHVPDALKAAGYAIVRNDEATFERVLKAIWDENGRNYDADGNFIRMDVVTRHRNMARAALDSLGVSGG